MHKRCSGIVGSLSNVHDFICSVSNGNQTLEPMTENSTDTRYESLKCTDKFCYIWNMTGAKCGAEASFTAGQEWVQLIPLSNNGRAFSAHETYLVCTYRSCIRNAMFYGSGTWLIKGDDVKRLECNEKSKVRWTCSATVRDS